MSSTTITTDRISILKEELVALKQQRKALLEREALGGIGRRLLGKGSRHPVQLQSV